MLISWCDKLASVPTIGLKLNFHYSPLDEILEALSPVIDAASKNDKSRLNLSQYDVSLNAVAFTTHDGFRYAADSTKLTVGFEHMLRTRVVSGGPPVMEMLSRPLPYTALLEEVADRLGKAALLINAIKPRTVARLGIVSLTKVSEDDIPPGVRQLVKYLGRPWRQEVESYTYRVVARLEDDRDHLDRCIYTVEKPDPGSDDDDIMTLNFDWQRLFKSEHAISEKTVEELLRPAQRAALSQFEELAEGSQFDEDIIRDRVSA